MTGSRVRVSFEVVDLRPLPGLFPRGANGTSAAAGAIDARLAELGGRGRAGTMIGGHGPYRIRARVHGPGLGVSRDYEADMTVTVPGVYSVLLKVR